jgi:hypothetical protein
LLYSILPKKNGTNDGTPESHARKDRNTDVFSSLQYGCQPYRNEIHISKYGHQASRNQIYANTKWKQEWMPT